MSIELKDKLVTLESLGVVYDSEVNDRNAAISAEATARAEAISAETAARTEAIANEVTARNAAIVEAINQAETGAPTKVELVSQMTDPDKNYLYIGEEQGYNSGHIYYLVDGAPVDKGVFGGTNIDDTLTISGQAADAKVTGDKIEEIKEELPDLESTVDWTSFATITIPLGWRVGYYSASTGSFSNNAHGISSGVPVYIPDDNVREFTIKAPDGYGVSVYKYNENGYVERYGSIGSTSAQGPNSVTVTPEAGHYYRFAIGYFSGATAGDYLTAEFINGIILTEKRRISNDVKKKHLNICIFGNSYSADSWAFVPFILKKYGITCNIYFYYRGSGSVDRLVEEWTDSSRSGLDDFGISHIRSFVHIDTRRELSWENNQRGVASAKDVVEIANSNANFDTWDLIVVNTGSRSQSFTTAPGNGDPRKGAEPYIRQLINLINESYTRPYKLAWFENYTSFDGYPGNPDLGYPAISPEDMDNRVGVLKSTETIMMAEPFDMVIPAGAAVFNARTNASLASTTLSTTGNLWCADKVHLQAGIPNYIANCAVVQSIFNQFYPHLSILGDNTRITDALITQYKCPFITSWCGSVMDSTELLYELGQKAAFMACKYPYDITPIYLPTDDTALAWFDSHSDRYWADALITRPEGT